MRFIPLLITMFALCGCVERTSVGDDVDIDIIETEYDGHSYIIFSRHGVIHNPTCSYCK